MKRVYLVTVSILLVLSFCMCLFTSCGETKATDFSSKPINNVYNNLKAGGRLAYTEGNLYYVNIVNDVVYNGLYTVDKDGTTAIELTTDTDMLSFVNMPYIQLR